VKLQDGTAAEQKGYMILQNFLLQIENFTALNALSLTASLSKDLGLSSLERAELAVRLQTQISPEISQSSILKAKTVADLFAIIKKNSPEYTTEIDPIIEIINKPVLGETTSQVRQEVSAISAKPKLFKIIYSAYFYGIGVLLTIPFWIFALILPSYSWLYLKLAPTWSRMFLFLVGCKLTVSGAEHILENAPQIFVVNHCSYLDSIALAAFLPETVAFVAKKELLKTWVLKTFFKKNRHIAVDRFDFSKALLGVETIKKTLRQGRSILIYPEGTFVQVAGVRPFRLGAFQVAVDEQIPICPIVIRGTRAILPDMSLAQPGEIKVRVLTPIKPQQQNFAEVIRLRNLVRQEFSAITHEPFINEMPDWMTQKM
jgi:1-acyl-sn-glycerol-3-phosphate acyltransferase